MSLIKPFRALRPVREKAKLVSCVPYDVAAEAEVRGSIGENPESFLRVTRPEAQFTEGNGSVADIFALAKHNLRELIESGTLVSETEPAIYFYRLSTDKHSQTGVVACCSLDEYEAGLIRKHEKTRPDKVEDRTSHMLELRAQTGLILLAFRGTDRIRKLIDEATTGAPLYDFVCAKGVRQTVWRSEETEEIVQAFREVPALYVADGHHRLESAARAREVLKGSDPGHTGDEEYNFVVAGMFPAEDLKILAYNRVVYELNGLTTEEFLSAASENFIVQKTGDPEPKYHGDLSVYVDGQWYSLHFNVNFISEPDPIERLDVSILQNYLLGPVLGITDPRTDKRIGFVGKGSDTGALEELVDSGEAKAAFHLYPTTMEDLLAISDAGEIMPPKSTWFEPKLKDGLFVHLI